MMNDELQNSNSGDRERNLYAQLHGPDAQASLRVCRLGLATRGGSDLTAGDVGHALERGINFLNWCGTPDALSETVADLGRRRQQVVVCVQFEARTASEAGAELRQILQTLHTDYVDILTFYYVEEPAEWQQIAGPG